MNVLEFLRDADDVTRFKCLDSHNFVVAYVYVSNGVPTVRLEGVTLDISEITQIATFMKTLEV